MTTERWQDLVLGAAALIWGVALLFPGDLFRGIECYAVISRAFPDWMWGALMTVFALTLLAISPLRLRRQAQALLGVMWSLVVVLICLDGLTLAGVMIGSLCAALALLHSFRYLQLTQMAQATRYDPDN